MSVGIIDFCSKKRALLVSFSLIFFFFLVSRLPFFLHFPIPGSYVSDAFEYFKVALEIENRQLPVFDIRTPGYPLFLFAVYQFFDSVLAIIIIQNLITLFAALFFVYAVYSNYKSLTYPAAAAVIFYFMSNNSIEADTNVVTDSLYTNLLIVFLGILIFCLIKNRFWAVLSLCTAIIIYVRPSGLFLLPIVLLLAIFMVKSQRYRRNCISLLAPVGIMLLTLAAYNFATLKKFSISPFGGSQLAGVVVTFMDADPSYQACENHVIASIRNQIPAEHKAVLNSKFDIDAYHAIYFENYYLVLPFIKTLIIKCNYLGYVEALPSIKKIAFDAIAKSPDKYVTFFLTNFYKYITDGNFKEHQLFYYSEVQRRYENIYIKHKPLKAEYFQFYVPDSVPTPLKQYAYKEYYNTCDLSDFDARQTALVNNPLFKIYDLYTLKINRVYLRNWFWPLALIALFLASGILFLKSGLSNPHALLIFVVCSFNICSAIVISLVEVSFWHYTFMTEFTYYFSVALSPLLLRYSK